MLLFLLSALIWAMPESRLYHYKERVQTPSHAEVLIVVSPGWFPIQYEYLAESLWKNGFKVYLLSFPLHAQHPAQMVQQVSQTLATLNKPHLVLHAFGGSVIAEQIHRFETHVGNLALITVPLHHRCAPALLHALSEGSWDHFPIPLSAASLLFKDEIHRRCQQSAAVQLPVELEVIAMTSNENASAPPENIRPLLSPAMTFVRSGPLYLHGEEPTHRHFLTHAPSISTLNTWLKHH